LRHYEIVAVIHPDQSDQVPEMIDRYKTMVADSGGQVHRVEDWGRLQLAYPLMKKLYKAHYFLLNVECESRVIFALEESFKFNDAVLRTLVTKRKRKETGDSVMMVSLNAKKERERNDKSERGEKPDRGERADRGDRPDSAGKAQSAERGEPSENKDQAQQAEA